MKALTLLLAASLVSACDNVPTVETRVHTFETGLTSWKANHGGFELELLQLVPDFVRASYSARNLPEAIVEGVAAYCVFGSVARNTSDGAVSYRVADWRFIDAAGQQHAIKTKSQWLEEWRSMGIRFAWSLLPDKQDFAVGDWNQGFVTVNVPHGSVVDLEYSWIVDGKTWRAKMEGLTCAEDI